LRENLPKLREMCNGGLEWVLGDRDKVSTRPVAWADVHWREFNREEQDERRALRGGAYNLRGQKLAFKYVAIVPLPRKQFFNLIRTPWGTEQSVGKNRRLCSGTQRSRIVSPLIRPPATFSPRSRGRRDKASELYWTEVLKSAEPDLLEIMQILGRLADKERRLGEVPVDEKEVIGVISSGQPIAIQKLRKEIRSMHYALNTETAYVGWVERFMKHLGSTQLENFGAPELKDFLMVRSIS